MRARMGALALLLGCATSTVGETDSQPLVAVDGAPPHWEGPDAFVTLTPMYVHTRDTLYVVDGGTFALTRVGEFATGGDYMTDIAVATDGTLYGVSQTKLYRIDRSTGRATFLWPLSDGNVGMTFLPDGQLLATDKFGGVRRVDPVSGAVTEIGSFGGGYATAGDLVAVADGTMYAISDEGPNGDEYDNNVLLTVDTATGAATPVGQIGFGGVYGCAYANGNVFAFTKEGLVIRINRTSGAGTSVRAFDMAFWGAAVSPHVPID